MFCVECGKPAESGHVCIECLSKKSTLFLKSFEVIMCPRCPDGEADVRSDIKEKIRKSLESQKGVKSFDVDAKLDGPVSATVTAEMILPGSRKTKEETKTVRIVVRKRLCENCSRVSGNYHEAVLQIRGSRKEEILEIVRSMVAPEYLARIDAKKEGYDARIVQKSEAIRVATELRKKFLVVSSFKLAGQKDGRSLYRSVYAIR